MNETMIETCTRCGHEAHEEDGYADHTDGDWYCDMCLDVAPSAETPIDHRDRQ